MFDNPNPRSSAPLTMFNIPAPPPNLADWTAGIPGFDGFSPYALSSKPAPLGVIPVIQPAPIYIGLQQPSITSILPASTSAIRQVTSSGSTLTPPAGFVSTAVASPAFNTQTGMNFQQSLPTGSTLQNPSPQAVQKPVGSPLQSASSSEPSEPPSFVGIPRSGYLGLNVDGVAQSEPGGSNPRKRGRKPKVQAIALSSNVSAMNSMSLLKSLVSKPNPYVYDSSAVQLPAAGPSSTSTSTPRPTTQSPQSAQTAATNTGEQQPDISDLYILVPIPGLPRTSPRRRAIPKCLTVDIGESILIPMQGSNFPMQPNARRIAIPKSLTSEVRAVTETDDEHELVPIPGLSEDSQLMMAVPKELFALAMASVGAGRRRMKVEAALSAAKCGAAGAIDGDSAGNVEEVGNVGDDDQEGDVVEGGVVVDKGKGTDRQESADVNNGLDSDDPSVMSAPEHDGGMTTTTTMLTPGLPTPFPSPPKPKRRGPKPSSHVVVSYAQLPNGEEGPPQSITITNTNPLPDMDDDRVTNSHLRKMLGTGSTAIAVAAAAAAAVSHGVGGGGRKKGGRASVDVASYLGGAVEALAKKKVDDDLKVKEAEDVRLAEIEAYQDRMKMVIAGSAPFGAEIGGGSTGGLGDDAGEVVGDLQEQSVAEMNVGMGMAGVDTSDVGMAVGGVGSSNVEAGMAAVVNSNAEEGNQGGVMSPVANEVDRMNGLNATPTLVGSFSAPATPGTSGGVGALGTPSPKKKRRRRVVSAESLLYGRGSPLVFHQHSRSEGGIHLTKEQLEAASSWYPRELLLQNSAISGGSGSGSGSVDGLVGDNNNNNSINIPAATIMANTAAITENATILSYNPENVSAADTARDIERLLEKTVVSMQVQMTRERQERVVEREKKGIIGKKRRRVLEFLGSVPFAELEQQAKMQEQQQLLEIQHREEKRREREAKKLERVHQRQVVQLQLQEQEEEAVGPTPSPSPKKKKTKKKDTGESQAQARRKSAVSVGSVIGRKRGRPRKGTVSSSDGGSSQGGASGLDLLAMAARFGDGDDGASDKTLELDDCDAFSDKTIDLNVGDDGQDLMEVDDDTPKVNAGTPVLVGTPEVGGEDAEGEGAVVAVETDVKGKGKDYGDVVGGGKNDGLLPSSFPLPEPEAFSVGLLAEKQILENIRHVTSGGGSSNIGRAPSVAYTESDFSADVEVGSSRRFDGGEFEEGGVDNSGGNREGVETSNDNDDGDVGFKRGVRVFPSLEERQEQLRRSMALGDGQSSNTTTGKVGPPAASVRTSPRRAKADTVSPVTAAPVMASTGAPPLPPLAAQVVEGVTRGKKRSGEDIGDGGRGAKRRG
ncbi:hypothetical protein HDU76_013842 [Blyttiomyces sp. JEL0837]|nr:hypothetical protein HDU76_013842 [Blyttiomyces sp. JEL0837]